MILFYFVYIYITLTGNFCLSRIILDHNYSQYSFYFRDKVSRGNMRTNKLGVVKVQLARYHLRKIPEAMCIPLEWDEYEILNSHSCEVLTFHI